MKRYPFLFLFFLAFSGIAQEFSADLQLKPRFEFRNGFKTLLTEEQDPAAFVSQRSRLGMSYRDEDLQLRFSVQNIRVWGDVPTMTTADKNGLAVFEAYADYNVSPSLSVRLGRQVLSYDNQRILGEVDWAQQAQSHDAALISWSAEGDQRLDIGVALNAGAEDIVQVPYVVNNYKNMQFAWYHFGVNNVSFSLLMMNTGYEYETALQKRDTDYLQTFGAFHRFTSGNFYGDVSAYGQTGKRNDRKVLAWYGGLNLNYRFSESWNTGLGAEYLSGTDRNDLSGENNSFTPLFGTNHAFNGFMDYFYVGNHQNTVGLTDIYGRITWTRSQFDLSFMPHVFYAAADMGSGKDKYLGTEIDIAGSYKVRNDLAVSFGYSQMFGSESLEILKGGDSGEIQNWAWVMVNFNPGLFSFSK